MLPRRGLVLVADTVAGAHSVAEVLARAEHGLAYDTPGPRAVLCPVRSDASERWPMGGHAVRQTKLNHFNFCHGQPQRPARPKKEDREPLIVG